MVSLQMIGAVLGAVLLLALAGYFFLGKGKRRRELRKLAAQMNLRPQPGDAGLRASGLLEQPLFRRDESHNEARIENVFHGKVRGVETLVFEYCLRENHKWKKADPVAFFHLEGKPLPGFELRPRNSSSAAAGLPFEENQRFSDIYALTGNDEQAVRDLFRREVLTFFERSENQDWGVVSAGGWLGVTVWPLGGRTYALEAKQIVAFLEDAKQVLFLLSGISGTYR